MEYILFLLMCVIFLAFIFVREAYADKRRQKEMIRKLYEDYGKLPEKEYSLERYERMDSFYRRHEEEGQIDDITWNDLNMDDIFKRMNYTFSASGEEYLYYMLRSPAKSAEELDHLEKVVEFFRTHSEERVRIQCLMTRLGHTKKYSLYDYLENLDMLGERSNRKHILLDLLFLPLLFLMPFAFSVSVFGIVALTGYNILTYFRESGEIEPYIISFSYLVRLINTCREMQRTEVPVCREEWKCIQESVDHLKKIDRHSYFVFSRNKNNTSGNPIDILLDYLRMVFHLDLIQFNGMLRTLQDNLSHVEMLLAKVGYVESAIAVGWWRASLRSGFCVPKLSEESSCLDITECYHPLLPEPVKNSICAERGVLITGSNASGKSTFLKSLAVNVILAQTIHTCTAESYRAPFYRIYSSMTLRDDIKTGESYYMAEIRAIKRILDAAGEGNERVICFVDEVLRGTNTVERIAASTQILKSLCGPRTLCFAATHDIELTQLLKEEYDNYHFEEDIREGDIVFPYQLMAGEASSRNAIRLLEIMGYRPEIIQKATWQAEHFVRTGKWEQDT